MNFKLSLLATAAVLAVAASVPQTASAAVVCPIATGPQAGLDCNLFVTFNADGSITTSGPGGNYDGSEDAAIGVINNSGHTITSFGISGPSIFGFDFDGIDGFLAAGAAPLPGNPDASGYGGPNGFFTIFSSNSGIVNFANGGIANGATDYFSLEESIDLAAPPVITAGVPEPASLALLGGGLAALGMLRRRRNKA